VGGRCGERLVGVAELADQGGLGDLEAQARRLDLSVLEPREDAVDELGVASYDRRRKAAAPDATAPRSVAIAGRAGASTAPKVSAGLDDDRRSPPTSSDCCLRPWNRQSSLATPEPPCGAAADFRVVRHGQKSRGPRRQRRSSSATPAKPGPPRSCAASGEAGADRRDAAPTGGDVVVGTSRDPTSIATPQSSEPRREPSCRLRAGARPRGPRASRPRRAGIQRCADMPPRD